MIYTTESQVSEVVRRMCNNTDLVDDAAPEASMAWFIPPRPYDDALSDIAKALRGVAAGSGDIEFRGYVVNTDDLFREGHHWFALALSAKLRNDCSPAPVTDRFSYEGVEV